jgi:hypothetical protein
VQWFASASGSSWAPIAGATSTTYSFAASLGESGDQYEAVFTNVAGTATSTSAALTVEVAPAISAQPTGQTVASGALVSFSAAATGTPTPSVQWEYSTDDGTTWQSFPGATTTTYSFVATGQQSFEKLAAVFTNPAGTATSAPATLTVTQEPTSAPSSNWSGYADTGATFTGISGSWTVPTVTCVGSSTSYSSEWIGIDGYSSGSVEQDGTEMDCMSGTPQYDAWYEMFGDTDINGGDEVALSSDSNPVAPGDVISASVSVVNNMWTLSLADVSSVHFGWSFSTPVPIYFPAAESSAEWVLERPEICNQGCVLTSLADFGTSDFTNAQATSTQGSGPIDVFANDEIDMLGNTNNVLAAPTFLNGAGTSFTDTWSGSS